MKRRAGQSVLYTVLLLPTLLLVLSLAVEVGSVQMQQLRIRWALDLASVSAAGVVDAGYYARTGLLRLDATRAEAVGRQFLYRNLQELGAAVGGDPGAAAIAASARLVVVNEVPARDPFTGRRLDRPAICIQATVAQGSGLMRWFGMPPEIHLTLHSVAEVRR
jgi:hypothetical protein